ncbi:hypothetical protein [Streptomyces sp. NPDC004232]|uniref:hypothetical protein n=1 Tax=unclassified Streptomyces TaxID=2593676 RepID=UPI001D47845D|nr:hypothetical protein [Streptomyces sp. tea 10]
MVSGTNTAHDVEAAAETLQEDLVRLQIQKQALERELAAVMAHLGSVRRALGAIETLMRDPAAAARSDASKPVASKAGSDADGAKKYGKLSEQIMEYLASADGVDVRARDVAVALGRASDSASINGVRSALDRLVGSSRVQRTGRGLYRALHA